MDVPARVEITAFADVHHFQAAKNGIAQNDWQAAEHGFGDDQGASVVARGENEKVCSPVKAGKLREVNETQEPHAIGNTQRVDAGLHFGVLRAIPSEDKVNP